MATAITSSSPPRQVTPRVPRLLTIPKRLDDSLPSRALASAVLGPVGGLGFGLTRTFFHIKKELWPSLRHSINCHIYGRDHYSGQVVRKVNPVWKVVGTGTLVLDAALAGAVIGISAVGVSIAQITSTTYRKGVFPAIQQQFHILKADDGCEKPVPDEQVNIYLGEIGWKKERAVSP